MWKSIVRPTIAAWCASAQSARVHMEWLSCSARHWRSRCSSARVDSGGWSSSTAHRERESRITLRRAGKRPVRDRSQLAPAHGKAPEYSGASPCLVVQINW